MNYRNLVGPLVAGVALLGLSANAVALDEAAAKKLAKRNDCFKCHAENKTKKGPSYKKIAAELNKKPRAEAEKAIMDNLTKAPKVKLEDGTEEEHKVIDSKDPKELQNLMEWILSR